MIDYVIHDGRQFAIILRSTFYSENIEFFTPGDYSQQLGYMNRPKGYVIQPHLHNVSHNVEFERGSVY